MKKIWFLSVLAIPMILAGCDQVKCQNVTDSHPTPTSPSSVQTHRLPSWLSISTADINSILAKGWGPAVSGNYVIYPASGTSRRLIMTLVEGLSSDKEIAPHRTAVSKGGKRIELKMKNGTSISFATIPNEPRPFQYIVTLDSSTGQQEKNAMISDDSGKVASVLDEIAKEK